jgi:tRNA-2-methylthio-N6-dimethylallyladenosine synthase
MHRLPGDGGEDGGRVPDDVVQRRFLQILRAVERNGFEANQRRVGSSEDIYIRRGLSDSGGAIGETWGGHSVRLAHEISCGAEPGDYVRARITSAGPHALYADPGGEPPGGRRR